MKTPEQVAMAEEWAKFSDDPLDVYRARCGLPCQGRPKWARYVVEGMVALGAMAFANRWNVTKS